MARQDIFKQIRGNESEHRKCANKFKQTNQAIQQIKHTNKNAKGSIYLALTLALALVKASSVQTNKRQTKASIENGTINSNKQIKQSNRTSKQTNSPKEVFTLLLVLLLHLSGRQDKQCSNKQAANKSENRKWANKFKQTNQAIKQIKQTKSTSGSVSCSFARRFVQRGFPA
jgi:hypothetical protein